MESPQKAQQSSDSDLKGDEPDGIRERHSTVPLSTEPEALQVTVLQVPQVPIDANENDDQVSDVKENIPEKVSDNQDPSPSHASEMAEIGQSVIAYSQAKSLSKHGCTDLNRNLVQEEAADTWYHQKLDKKFRLSSAYASVAKKYSSIPKRLPHPLFQTLTVNYVFGGFLSSDNSSKSKHAPRVKFAPEVVQVTELKKDVAGKERVVPRSNKPKRKGFRKVVDSSGNIICNPNEETFDIVSDTGFPCCGECPCFGRSPRSRHSISQNVSMNYRVQAENFSASLEQAGNYFDGNMTTARGAAEIFYFPCFIPMTENLNCPAAKIWLFTYALTSLFHDGQPTDEEFQQLVHHFYQIGRDCEQVCDLVSAYCDLQLDLEARIVRLLYNMLKRLRIRFKFGKSYFRKTNPWKERVLKLGKIPRPLKDSDVAIMMGGIWNEPDLKWGNFKGYPLSFRIQALQSLLNDVEQCVRVINTQIRFLTEDIKAGKFEDEDKHIVSVLILMDSVLKFFVNSHETTVMHEKNLRQVVRSFVKDTYEFLRTARFAVAKALELRDTMQLCHAYISKHYRSTVATFKTIEKESSGCQRCWDWVLRRQYEYKEEDFFRTPFQRELQMFYVSSGRAFIMLKHERNEQISIEKIKAASTIVDESDEVGSARLRILDSIFSAESLHSNPGMEDVRMSIISEDKHEVG